MLGPMTKHKGNIEYSPGLAILPEVGFLDGNPVSVCQGMIGIAAGRLELRGLSGTVFQSRASPSELDVAI